MNVLKAALSLSMVLVLAGLNAGCTTVDIRGTVVELEYEESKIVCGAAKRGKAPKCRVVDRCWEIDIKDSTGEVHELCIEESEWEKYKVGDAFPRGRRA